MRATCIFTKIKLQIIASLLYKIGAHFGQYFGYPSPKVSEDQKKKKKKRSWSQIGADFGQYYEYLSPKVSEDQQKKRPLPQIRTDFRKIKQKKVLV